MIDNWQALHTKEKLLAEKDEDLRRDQQKLKRVTDDYHHHFFQAIRFFSELQEQFNQHETANFFREMADDVQRDTRRINEQLEEQEWQIKKANHHLQEEISEIENEKKRLILEEEEETK